MYHANYVNMNSDRLMKAGGKANARVRGNEGGCETSLVTNGGERRREAR